MSTVTVPRPELDWPDHTQLPAEDGVPVTNFEEHPQSILLTDSIGPVLQRLHPDGQYAIGQNSGIYWDNLDPPLAGCRVPDWYYVPDVPPRLEGQVRRSYVLWKEKLAPLIILEFASNDGAEERDRTPRQGKFWIYERVVRAPYYGIFEVVTGLLEVYRLIDGRYRLMTPNEHGRYPIAPLGVELGVWQGAYQNVETHWLRWWDMEGNLLPIGHEQADTERQLKEQAQHQAEQAQRQAEQAQRQTEQVRQEMEQAQRRAEHLAERLRALGIDPDKV